jgi:hypothetical protein
MGYSKLGKWKKNRFWIRVTSYLHTPLYQIFNFQKWITVFFSYSMGYSKLEKWKKNTHWLFSKQIDSVVKYTLIVFKDKLHYFFTVWVTRNYENEKKNTFWIRVTSYLHTPL